MRSEQSNQNSNEINRKKWDKELFDECLQKAEGNKLKAKAMYQHRCSKEQSASSDELDQREKWPMLLPLLILYLLGTIGVLLLVFGFLGYRLDWW